MRIGPVLALLTAGAHALDYEYDAYPAKSGVGIWVDVDTPQAAMKKKTSRGQTWDLVMSDEFEIDGRSFKAGKDHLWTALDIPDGVNAALELYNSSNVYTKGGKLINKVEALETNITYFNQWLDIPSFQTGTTYYSAGMMQSWNKFCIQGGMIEVAAKLPGAINNISDSEHASITTNPNALGFQWVKDQKVPLPPLTPVIDGGYYPTWPGIWLMGNLGRALFTASTTRMWPWTYNECDPDLASNQIISACNATPGYGLNPNQGRGAPEIDILEGGGAAISSSIQIAPGMPDEYRRVPVVRGGPDTDPTTNSTNIYCVYGKGCTTPGANMPDAPTSAFASRGHKSWYQGLRYAANNNCPAGYTTAQGQGGYYSVKAAQDSGRINANTCLPQEISAACDVHADLGVIDNNGTLHWGINYEGRCFPIANGYIGAFLCDPDAKNPKCEAVRKEGVADTNQMAKFEYQMDAISVNWAINHDAYVTFYIYTIEWVMGANGYIRWTLMDAPIFETPASALTTPPQATAGKPRNPKKIMIEEPLYFIFNVALAKAWGTTPPNADIGPCRGNATHPAPGSYARNHSNNICDSFPMYMEIDYIRVYQDPSSMSIGCDPPTHPTKKWIDGHLQWYTDTNNPLVRVDGGATCNSDNDCLSMPSAVPSGRCANRRCACVTGYGGPRCTKYLGASSINGPNYFGPQLLYPIVLATVVVALVIVTAVVRKQRLTVAATKAVVTNSHVGKIKDAAGDDDDDDEYVEMTSVPHRRFYAPTTTSVNSA
ncbi:Aste57867_15681 [Aphanomyces stellatus]|uniref:Aste57867_15681 protein n=1 Tax=Aphanomyces stellatus TaxID=120398 RepID=A0A485L4L3_9STRA|nr:hypothetical protein As57867_015625 [Aphanomyces stellatus]VFT92474.1 Aste57867_15681 [Aphanomyces stellatus]